VLVIFTQRVGKLEYIFQVLKWNSECMGKCFRTMSCVTFFFLSYKIILSDLFQDANIICVHVTKSNRDIILFSQRKGNTYDPENHTLCFQLHVFLFKSRSDDKGNSLELCLRRISLTSGSKISRNSSAVSAKYVFCGSWHFSAWSITATLLYVGNRRYNGRFYEFPRTRTLHLTN